MNEITDKTDAGLKADNIDKLEKVDFALVSSSPVKKDERKKRKKSTKKAKKSKHHKVTKPTYKKRKFVHLKDISSLSESKDKINSSKFLPGLLIGSFIGSAVTNFILEGLK